jgi:uncharacterized surface protein with fasciclin (FAS1) repeats
MFTYSDNAIQDGGSNCEPNILDVAALYPEFTLSAALIARADLADIFSCPGPFTALLPTNAAWDSVDPVFLEFILRPENAESLEDILLYHILTGSYPSAQLLPGPLETLLPGETVAVSINPTMFNDAGVEGIDLPACNGFIYGIDTVLLPFRKSRNRSRTK